MPFTTRNKTSHTQGKQPHNEKLKVNPDPRTEERKLLLAGAKAASVQIYSVPKQNALFNLLGHIKSFMHVLKQIYPRSGLFSLSVKV